MLVAVRYTRQVASCHYHARTHSGGSSVPSLLTFLIQIAVVLGVAQAVGWLFQRLHQPRVVGEMTAGILLGPSVLGWLTPTLAAALFPPTQLGALNALSHLGLLLFMFLVGLQLQPQTLRGQGYAVVVISHTSIVIPFALGALLAVVLYPHLADPTVPRLHFALFLGTALSITAFPVLARILAERHLLHTQVGALAIACAAVDDVTAWCLLAGVVLLKGFFAVSERPARERRAGPGKYQAVVMQKIVRVSGTAMTVPIRGRSTDEALSTLEQTRL